MAKTIAVIGALDTKGDEFLFVKKEIEKRGHTALVINVGIVEEPGFEPDVAADEVARAAREVYDVRMLRPGKQCAIVRRKGTGFVDCFVYEANSYEYVLYYVFDEPEHDKEREGRFCNTRNSTNYQRPSTCLENCLFGDLHSKTNKTKSKKPDHAVRESCHRFGFLVNLLHCML